MTTRIKEEVLQIAAPEFRGGNYELGACQDIEVCLDGAAGTGKTYAALYKIHVLLSLFPGSKALVLRKFNVDLAGSAMATFQEQILHPHEGVVYYGGNRVKPAGYRYPNGSFMAVNGLDRPTKVKSFECDLAFINEATECRQEDMELVRMRLRKGVIPYQQIIMDCNPDAPTHWLNQRMESGVTTRLLSRHEDNPRYFDLDTKDWTAEGHRYVNGILGDLTGVLKLRYRYGVWAASEGMVYQESWDLQRNVIPRFEIPRAWPRYLAIDFGYQNPFVCLWAAIDPDGRIIIYRQIYRSKRLVEDHAKDIALASGWFHLLPKDHPQYAKESASWADPLPRELVCDHDAEGRATLERHLGMMTTPAYKAISEGIQKVAARLRPAGDGRPRLQIIGGCLSERDTELAKMKLPTSLESELPAYVWDTRQGRRRGEVPMDANDHAADALRYLVAHFDLMPQGVSYYKNIWG